MEVGAARKRKLNTVCLKDAVLCVQCENISDSPHDRCLVCGSSSLFNLHRVLNGALPRSSELSGTKYNLEITVKVSGMTASDLNQTAESIAHLLSSSQNGEWEALHIEVDTVLDNVPALAA
jgi:hypothetical protein